MDTRHDEDSAASALFGTETPKLRLRQVKLARHTSIRNRFPSKAQVRISASALEPYHGAAVTSELPAAHRSCRDCAHESTINGKDSKRSGGNHNLVRLKASHGEPTPIRTKLNVADGCIISHFVPEGLVLTQCIENDDGAIGPDRKPAVVLGPAMATNIAKGRSE